MKGQATFGFMVTCSFQLQTTKLYFSSVPIQPPSLSPPFSLKLYTFFFFPPLCWAIFLTMARSPSKIGGLDISEIIYRFFFKRTSEIICTVNGAVLKILTINGSVIRWYKLSLATGLSLAFYFAFCLVQCLSFDLQQWHRMQSGFCSLELLVISASFMHCSTFLMARLIAEKNVGSKNEN